MYFSMFMSPLYPYKKIYASILFILLIFNNKITIFIRDKHVKKRLPKLQIDKKYLIKIIS